MKKIILLALPIILFGKINIIKNELYIDKSIKSWSEIQNKNLVRQKYDYSCGSASVSTIMKYYYNQNISEIDVLNTILSIKSIDEKADLDLSFMDLSKYIKSINFKPIGFALNIQTLKKLNIPVIIFLKLSKSEHFTVFRGIDENNIYLADPSFGNIQIKIPKFKEMFYQRSNSKYPGKVLAILPTTNTQKENINQNFMTIQKKSNLIYEIIINKSIK